MLTSGQGAQTLNELIMGLTNTHNNQDPNEMVEFLAKNTGGAQA
jgi:hypothetical protein